MANNNSTSIPIQLPLPIDNEIIIIQLTKGYSAIIDFIDVDLSHLKWHSHGNSTIYAVREYWIKKKKYRTWIHRIVLERKLGRSLLPGEVIDHIDNNSMNNRRNNLRVASMSENKQNSRKPKNNTSGYKGVTKHGNNWEARIGVDWGRIHLGTFKTKEEAHKAYKEAADKYYGEFARYE